MAIEIERKFLVKETPFQLAKKSEQITQGYLINDEHKVVRIRKKGTEYYLTIKGNTIGLSRLEYEFLIPEQDAQAIQKYFCKDSMIHKTRHYVEFQGHTWEVDEFHGENEGLVVAEIELDSEDESFEKPEWIGDEVSNDERYYNMNLSTRPFSNW
jgi:CYTH domain-containing protein